MGLFRDSFWLRSYLNAKATSDLIDAIDSMDDTKKTRGRKKRSSRTASKSRQEKHLGFWDFLDKQIQDEKKEAKENPTSWKEVLKYMGILLLISLGFYLLSKLLGLFEHWWNTVVTPL